MAGGGIRDIAGRFAIARSTVSRHVPHIQARVRAAQERAEDDHILDIAQQLRAINSAALDVLRQARGAGDLRTQLAACTTVLGQITYVRSVEVEQQNRELEGRIAALEQLLAGRNGEIGQWPRSRMVV